MRSQAILILSDATKLAMSQSQIIGEKSEYYVTLRQLEEVCRKHSTFPPTEGRDPKEPSSGDES